jgi:hypothetical protein
MLVFKLFAVPNKQIIPCIFYGPEATGFLCSSKLHIFDLPMSNTGVGIETLTAFYEVWCE